MDDSGSSISTRVGEQYQADIPFLISKEEYVDAAAMSGEGSSFWGPDESSMWSEEEEEGFLLALYVFGKNLSQVKSLVQSKTMEEIQRFYYGRFYSSTKRRRWSEGCRKRSRRCVYGGKIFAGWRLQELLSRLLSSLASDRESELVETFAVFGEGKLPLHEFVFKTRDLSGLNSLIEGVGIGKGKKDLTSASAGARPEAPILKELSGLSSSEVVNLLTGGFRMSKARSHELFWEAVWPRLLDRGWHSKKPRDYFTSANSQSLVFLVPEVKKFSRKLLKGTHYFDSIADILQRIASDPALIEDHHRHCYLKPPSSLPILDSSDDEDSAKSSSDITVAAQSNGEKKPPARAWIDLNALPGDDDEEESVKTAPYERESGGNERRHGVRNRPPTTKVLEAVAAGYLTVSHKRKWRDY